MNRITSMSRRVALAFVGCGLAVLSATSLSAATAGASVRCSASLAYQPGVPARCEQFRYARETLAMGYEQFIARKQDFVGSGCQFLPAQRQGQTCNKPAPYDSFDWTTDGCSQTPDTWKAVFDGPCQQHDFGYRNFHNGLRLQPTEAMRGRVDRKFLYEMGRICKTWSLLQRATCRTAARAMYDAVRVANHWP
ncbi:MAG: hypothetical protein QOK49_4274 [Baekduia sp.]|jgi:hypothetical protein|nr:hypothetical protein [Baekduia sp.]